MDFGMEPRSRSWVVTFTFCLSPVLPLSLSTLQHWACVGQVERDLWPPAHSTGNIWSKGTVSSPAPTPPGPVSAHVQTYFKVVRQDVVGFPEVLLILSIVEVLTGGVISKFPPFPIVYRLTLAPEIPGVIHALSFCLDQDIVPKLKRQAASEREHWEGKGSVRYPLEDAVTGGLSSGFSNCVPWSPRVPQSTFKVTLGNNGSLSGQRLGLQVPFNQSSLTAPFST